jgi:hypothetical protein
MKVMILELRLLPYVHFISVVILLHAAVVKSLECVSENI